MNQDQDFCLVRLTQKNFFVDFMQQKEKLRQQKRMQIQGSISSDSSFTPEQQSKGPIYFQLYDRGVRVPYVDLYNSLPEKVYRYFAGRSNIIHQNIFLDPFCQHGSSLVHFAVFSGFRMLYGCEQSVEKIECAKHNAKLYNVRQCMDFINAEFQNQNFTSNFKADLIFIKPDYEYDETLGQAFSLERHLRPSITGILPKAFKVANNIILVLPKYTKLE